MNNHHAPTGTAPDWPAPFMAGSAVRGTVPVPGSKSLTNRFLVLAALASSPSTLRKPLHSRDSELMVSALETLGASIEEIPTDSPFGPDLVVSPLPGPTAISRELVKIECGLAGTVMRFVPPLAALRHGVSHFDGDASARVRPMGPVLDGLRAQGVSIDDDARGTLPFTLTGSGHLPGGEVTIDASGSSQFISALLMAGIRCDTPLTLRHDSSAGSVPSLPHVDMTVEVLRNAGVTVEALGHAAWRVHPADIAGLDVIVEPDLSNAGPFLAAAVATGGTVSIPDWPEHTTQGGDHWRQILPRFGATVEYTNGTLTVTGPQELNGVDLDLSEAGELAPTTAALCALATSRSQLRGIAHLRGHETDRLAALCTEINRLGGNATETQDGLIIEPAPLHGGRFHSYEDHRMATAGAIIGLCIEGVTVENIATTAKTLPDFPAMWTQLVGHGS